MSSQFTLGCNERTNVLYPSPPAAVTNPEGAKLKARVFSQLKSLLYSVDPQIMDACPSMESD